MAHKTAARTHASRAISRAPSPDRAVAAPRLFRTKNDIPETTRVQVIGLLNQRLADAIDLQTQCKQAHWNVKGPSFIALHELFDDVDEAVEGYIDLIAERVVQLGGVAEGTARVVAERSSLDVYPLVLSNGLDHVDALSNALATFGRTVRLGIEEMDELSDADSADILTEVSRGVDKYLWFVEAHQQSDPDLNHSANGRG
jgi:starvation-inducible DNA-binding protein